MSFKNSPLALMPNWLRLLLAAGTLVPMFCIAISIDNPLSPKFELGMEVITVRDDPEAIRRLEDHLVLYSEDKVELDLELLKDTVIMGKVVKIEWAWDTIYTIEYTDKEGVSRTYAAPGSKVNTEEMLEQYWEQNWEKNEEY